MTVCEDKNGLIVFFPCGCCGRDSQRKTSVHFDSSSVLIPTVFDSVDSKEGVPRRDFQIRQDARACVQIHHSSCQSRRPSSVLLR